MGHIINKLNYNLKSSSLQAFMRALVMDDHVEFHFANIGRLVIRCREVQPIFCKDFLCKYAFCQEIVKDKACQYLP